MEKREMEINGNKYAMLIPAVRQSMPIANRVAVLLGGVLGSLGGDTAKGGMEKFSAAMSKVDPEDLDKIMMDSVPISKLVFDRNVSVNSSNDFERHFGQHRADVYPVCLWVVWECVKDFFPQLGGLVSTAKAAAESAFQSQAITK
jgi:hypothetical protein